MDENLAVRELADGLWRYFKPKVEEMLGSYISFYRAQVAAAPSGGKVTVKRPFDDTALSLPYVGSMERAAAGTQVVVAVFGKQRGNTMNSVVIGDGQLTNL